MRRRANKKIFVIRNRFKLNYLEILGAIVLFAGWLFAFLPHASHTAIESTIGVSDVEHWKHVVLGSVVAILGVVILVVAEKNS